MAQDGRVEGGQILDVTRPAGSIAAAVPEVAPLDIPALYAQEWRRLMALALALTHDRAAAEDLVQDAFVALQARWQNLADQDAAAGYLRVTVLNRARSTHRRHLVSLRHRPERVHHAPGADARAVAEEDNRAVRAVLQRLPRRQQQVLALRYWGGMKDAEIAQALGISVGTVKSTSSRALKAAAKYLEGP